MRRTVLAAFAACLVFSFAGVAFANGDIEWHPQKGEFYPTDAKSFPSVTENPHPQTRGMNFNGKALDVFTKINMVTQIQLPEPPVMINIGNPESYVVDVSPEFSSVFVKPIRESDMTNLIITTEGGTYLFVLKENPYKPFDMHVRVGNPRRQPTESSNSELIAMAVSGRRHAAFQFEPVEIRSPMSTAFAFDEVLNFGAKIQLRRVVSMPRRNISVYHFKIMNQVDGAGANVKPADYVVDEKTVVAQRLVAVAVPDAGTGLLKVGEAMDMFLLIGTGEIPDRMRFRFAMQGNRSVPVEVDVSTSMTTPSPSNAKYEAVETVDERLMKLYADMEAKQGERKFPLEEGQAGTKTAPTQEKKENGVPNPPSKPKDDVVLYRR